VYEKLKRQFILDPDEGEPFVNQCIENTKYFADLCQYPDWIDPKFSNPSGKELPEFPVKDQNDYKEFLEWSKDKNGSEDDLYLRFKCDVGLRTKIPEDKHNEYRARLEEEFEVIEYHKFSSYMLIVMDYRCRKNSDLQFVYLFVKY
jgi:DNA polymerase-3 subunit alpha